MFYCYYFVLVIVAFFIRRIHSRQAAKEIHIRGYDKGLAGGLGAIVGITVVKKEKLRINAYL